MPEPAPDPVRPFPFAVFLRFLGFLLFAGGLAVLLRWQVTPLAWDKSEGSRAILLDRWTGRTWLVQKQGLRETFKLTP